MTSVNTTPGIPAAAAGTITLGGDLTVNRMGFGAMRLTGKGIWGPPKNSEEAVRVLQRAVELGGHFFDTAYPTGLTSRTIIADALYPYPIVIATILPRAPGPDQWVENGGPSFSARILTPQAAPVNRSPMSLPASPQVPAVAFRRLADFHRGIILHIGSPK